MDATVLNQVVLDLLRAARRTRLRPSPGGARLSMPQLVILDAVARAGPLGITAVAAEAALSQPTISRALPGLERAGLVRRRANGEDGRASVLALTDEGQLLMERTREWVDVRVAELWERFSPDEQQVAPELLAKVIGFIEGIS